MNEILTGSDVPPGWDYNPSAWAQRWPIIALSIVGFGVASYLSLFQLGVVETVWEPSPSEAAGNDLCRQACDRSAGMDPNRQLLGEAWPAHVATTER